ncbi:unnamed protein product [Mytilus coruscus]|uniref:G-protein coupled receptors family 1 profile domain-containing protein n=1 Tax=Mytilus coruscus TaxID=42192 RepID=A0A6J8ESA9_MYTCO|nr:unnamed protein product [Mytilus coruscus]
MNRCVYEDVVRFETKSSSLSHFRTQYAYMHGPICIVICIFGIILNAANIVVLTRKNMMTSINVILTWLAVVDNLKMTDYLIFAIGFYVMKDPDLALMNTYNIHKGKYLEFHASFAIVCHNIGVWLTVSLAIFRFLYIWFPGRGKLFCTVTRAKITVALIYVTIAIICIPNYYTNFLDKKTPKHLNSSNVTCHAKYTVNMIDQKDPVFIANTYIQAIFTKLVPCVLLTVLTFLLIYAMHQAYQKRKVLLSQGHDQDARRHHEHNRTTGMLLAVVILFLLVELPFGILTLMIVFSPAEWMTKVYDNLGEFHELLALFNNAVNFLLYCSMSKQFRKTFISIFCRCLPKQNYRIINMTEMSQFNNSMNHNHLNTTHVQTDGHMG